MVGRNDDAPPSPRDVKIIALEAELQEYKTRDAKTNQIINDLTKKSRDLANEVWYFFCHSTTTTTTTNTVTLFNCMCISTDSFAKAPKRNSVLFEATGTQINML